MLELVPNLLHNFKGPRKTKQRPKDHTLKVSAPTCCHAKRNKESGNEKKNFFDHINFHIKI